MISKYTLSTVTDFSQWDQLVENSPQGTIFSLSSFLTLTKKKYQCYLVHKKSQLKAGVCLLLNEQETCCQLDDFVIYNGILFIQDEQQKIVRARSQQFDITEFVISQLDQRFDGIELALSPQFEDMRPFLWHNYHSPNPEDKFIVDLRYTSYLDISELINREIHEENTNIFSQLDTLRKRNIREARNKNIKVLEGNKTSHLIKYYQQLMASQEEDVAKNRLDRLYNLIDCLINNGQGIMTYCKNQQDQVVYILFFGIDNKRAYYLYGAGDPSSKDRFRGSITFWDTFRLLAHKYGVNQVDLEGINSPKRGWFKMSFGGTINPYYQVYKR